MESAGAKRQRADAPLTGAIPVGGGAPPPPGTGAPASRCVRVYAPSCVEARSWRPLSELVAVAGAHGALSEMVEKRRSGARAIYERMRRARMLVLCGHPGSGRRTLVRAYAAHAGLTLVEVRERGPALTLADIDAAYAAARAAPPALVLFHGCDGSIAGDAHAQVQSALAAELDDAERDASAWSIVAMDAPYTMLPVVLAERAFYAGWLAPPSFSVGAQRAHDGGEARRALVLLMMRERAPNVADITLERIYTENAERIVEASHNTTPRQLAAFMDRVFSAPLSRFSAGEINIKAAADLLPSTADVAALLHVDADRHACILRRPPEEAVVAPYERLATIASVQRARR